MSSFVHYRHRPEEKPKLDQVYPGLVHEVVVSETVRPDFTEPVGPHPTHQNEHRQAGPNKPWREQEPDLRIEPADVIVGILPRLHRDVRKIQIARAAALSSGGT